MGDRFNYCVFLTSFYVPLICFARAVGYPLVNGVLLFSFFSFYITPYLMQHGRDNREGREGELVLSCHIVFLLLFPPMLFYIHHSPKTLFKSRGGRSVIGWLVDGGGWWLWWSVMIHLGERR